MSATAPRLRRRVAARVEGTVQGVGFRPYVYRLARELGLSGLVRNDERGVVRSRSRGRRPPWRASSRGCASEAPPLARIERVLADEREPAGREGSASSRASARASRVPPSRRTPRRATTASPSCSIPSDRRFRYPFVNCTNCGPRFTIVRGVPYDRPLTTMAGFAMCDRCRAEYDDPRRPPLPRAAERLPRVRAACMGGRCVRPRWSDAISRPLPMRSAAGAIVAVKGLGGFHLACVAASERRGRAAARAQAS